MQTDFSQINNTAPGLLGAVFYQSIFTAERNLKYIFLPSSAGSKNTSISASVRRSGVHAAEMLHQKCHFSGIFDEIKHRVYLGLFLWHGGNMRFVEIYTDGACSGNPGPGGWGAILRCDGREKEMSGGEAHTTNNRMELSGVINALSALKFPCKVKLTTDSKYVVDGVTKGWAQGWKKRGWKKSDGKPALNPDLWEKLLELLAVHDVEFCWIKGHAGHEENERCDRLAVAQRDIYSAK